MDRKILEKINTNLDKCHFQTLITAPLFPVSSLKRFWPKAKFYQIKVKKDLKKIDFSGLKIISFPDFSLGSLSLLIELERLLEANFDHTQLILVFDQNLERERLFAQIKESYFLKRLVYIDSLETNKNENPHELFHRLSENEQMILQQISQNSLESLFYQKNELEYLIKTGLIKSRSFGNHQLISDFFKKYLQKSFPSFRSEINLKNNKIFYKTRNITSCFSCREQKALVFLIRNQKKVVRRDELASRIWGADYIYSDCALDQFICRLRKKLAEFNLNSLLVTLKKGGFVFNFPKPIGRIFKYNSLSFKPFSSDPKLLKFYLRWFKNPALRKDLFCFTPKSGQQIKAWLNNLIHNFSFAYFGISNHNHLIGHIGLKMINQEEESGFIGTFLKKEACLKKHGEGIYRFILNQAQKRNLKVVYKDVCQDSQVSIHILQKLGFNRISERGSVWRKKL